MSSLVQQLYAEIDRLRADRPDEAKLADLGAQTLADALAALDWHQSSVRVARAPRLSAGAATSIVDTARRLGIE